MEPKIGPKWTPKIRGPMNGILPISYTLALPKYLLKPLSKWTQKNEPKRGQKRPSQPVLASLPKNEPKMDTAKMSKSPKKK